MKTAVILALLLAPLCFGQPVYRCQEAAGISYQDYPCAGPGEVLALQPYRPTARDVARSERQRVQVRRFLRLVQLRRAETSTEVIVGDRKVRPVAEPVRKGGRVILLQSQARHLHVKRRFDRHWGDRHWQKRHSDPRWAFGGHRSDRHWQKGHRDTRGAFGGLRSDRHWQKLHHDPRRAFSGHRSNIHRQGLHIHIRPSGKHPRATMICPLGLTNCKKVWLGPSFR